MKALILSGGGARGAYEAGLVKSLLTRESFDIVCGTSIGAINGAFIAQDKISELETVWHTIADARVIQFLPSVTALVNLYQDYEKQTTDHWLKRAADWIKLVGDAIGLFPFSRFLGLRGVLSGGPIESMLIGKLDIDQLKRSLVVTATNLSYGTCDAFYSFVNVDETFVNRFRAKPGANRHPLTSENFLLAVRSSAAIPGAFEPVEMNLGGPTMQQYVDGGVANNTPIGLAIDSGADDVSIVFMDPAETKPRPQDLANLGDIAYASFDVMQQKILEDDLKIATAVNEAVKAGQMSEKTIIKIKEYRPNRPLGLSVLGFNDQASLDAAFAQGEQDGLSPVSG